MKLLTMKMLVTLLLATVAVGTGVLPPSVSHADDEPRKDSLTNREYFLYTPAKVDPAKTYWLVVGVHGAKGNGKGAGGLANWADKHDCIVVGPSFPHDGYQGLAFQSDEQLIAIAKDVGKTYKLQPKLFVGGFSGGSQYAHRFMLKHPQLVVGCAAHSGGTWETGGVNPAAKAIPFVMSCGEKDTGKSYPEATYGRLEWAKLFEAEAKKAGFFMDSKFFPNVGHSQCKEASAMTEECFVVATDLIPYFQSVLDEVPKLEKRRKKAEALELAKEARAREPLSEDGLSAKVVASAREKLDPIIARLEKAQQRAK